MKKPLVALLAVTVAAAFAALAASAETTPGAAAGGTITVTGNGVVQSEPDTVEWSFGVTVEADSATAALSRANTAVNRVVAAVRAAGVAQKDIRTQHVSLSPQTDQNGRLADRFVASTAVQAIVRNLSQAGRIVDAAVGAGANGVWGPTFSESDRERLYREALRAAYAQARASAQALAEASGLTLGRVTAVQEGGGVQPVPMASEAARAGGDVADTQVEPGRSSTYATVSVTFATS